MCQNKRGCLKMMPGKRLLSVHTVYIYKKKLITHKTAIGRRGGGRTLTKAGHFLLGATYHELARKKKFSVLFGGFFSFPNILPQVIL